MAETESNPAGDLVHCLLAPLVCQSIGTVARLGVADQLADGALSMSVALTARCSEIH